jgi:hypothetical protein
LFEFIQLALSNLGCGRLMQGHSAERFCQGEAQAPAAKSSPPICIRTVGFFFRLLTLAAGVPALAVAQTGSPQEVASDSLKPICATIDAAARTNGLPTDFLVRLIWLESRFSPDAIGPVTRIGQRAQGIAQFMPSTAAERHLLEPFDPVEALPKSGEFLAELRDKFGNIGLAAAAYNAGPRRVSEFIAGLRDVPVETHKYVLAITGRSIEDWARLAKLGKKEGDPGDPRPAVTCSDLIDSASQSSQLQLRQNAVPSWCVHLHHPNPNLCGTVHAAQVSKSSSFAKVRALGSP